VLVASPGFTAYPDPALTLAWAKAWPERTWAVEGADGLGHLLARQLAAAGEYVLDVPPKLGAWVRLLGSGAADKNDPDDARSAAVAALRSPTACLPVRAEDHATVLKVWPTGHRDLFRASNGLARPAVNAHVARSTRRTLNGHVGPPNEQSASVSEN
jgi:hypothetical protein